MQSRLERLIKLATLIHNAGIEASMLWGEHNIEADNHVRLDIGHIEKWLRGEIAVIETDGQEYATVNAIPNAEELKKWLQCLRRKRDSNG